MTDNGIGTRVIELEYLLNFKEDLKKTGITAVSKALRGEPSAPQRLCGRTNKDKVRDTAWDSDWDK